MKQFLDEYVEIRERLEQELLKENKMLLYTDMCILICRIFECVIKSRKIKERLGEIMGGKVLELHSEKIARENYSRGIAQGTINTLVSLVQSGLLELKDAAREAGLSVEDFADKMKE